MPEIRQEDHGLIEPGMRVKIGPKLRGKELYGIDDPAEFKHLCGKEVVVSRVVGGSRWMVYVDEDEKARFLMEEIECIIEDAEISESEEPINVLLGCVV